tara:strand:- start:10268 stop:11935 length:1668 start_codon:yes stop_codon:yes gene_type:complete
MDLSTSYTIKAQVTGQNEIGGLTKGLGKLQKSTNSTSAAMNKLKTAAGNAFGALKALAPAIGVAGLGKLVNDTLQLGDQLEKMSQKTGLAVPVLDKLRQAANLGGTEFKTLSRALPTLAKNMQDASDGIGTAKDAFERLGLGVTNADGSLKSLDQMFFEIGDKIKAMDDRTLAAANAAEIFGTGMGAKLIPIMNQGSEAIQNLSTGFTQLSAERMAKLNDDVAQMGEKFNVLKVQLTEAVLPTLTKLVEIIGKGAERFAALPAPVKGVATVLALLAPAVIAIAPVFASLVISFKFLATVKLGAMFAAAVPAIGALMPVLAPFLIGGAVLAGLIALGKLIGTVVGHIFAAKEQIGTAMAAIGQALLSPFTGFADFVGNVFRTAVDKIRSAFMAIPNAVKSAISAATAPLRSFLNFINRILAKLAALRRRRNSSGGGGSGGSGGSGTPPGMAAGGVVSSPQLIYAGEAGSEYVIPARKAAQFSKNYLAGYRGSAAVPRFAEGGYVAPNVNITTGAVTQMDGTNFITTKDLASAVQSGINQTINLIQGDFKTRRALGL